LFNWLTALSVFLELNMSNAVILNMTRAEYSALPAGTLYPENYILVVESATAGLPPDIYIGNNGLLTSNIQIPSGSVKLPSWVQTQPYVEGAIVTYTDGFLYEASGSIAANTAWAIGWLDNQWHRTNKRRPDKITRFLSNGLFTPDPRAISTVVEMVGGGGSGSGIPYYGYAGCACGTGGQGGSYAKARIDTPGTAPISVTVGAAGAAVSGAAGNNGGASQFGTFVNCPGGYCGLNIVSGNVHVIYAAQTATASPTSSGATPIVFLPTTMGGSGWSCRIAASTPSVVGGFANGGGTPLGQGGLEEAAVGGDGGIVSIVRAGSGYGFGGAGIASNASSAGSARTGGSGGPGIVIVTESY
jgi:hypothetical protein